MAGQHRGSARSVSRGDGADRETGRCERQPAGNGENRACALGYGKPHRSRLAETVVLANLPAGISFRAPDGAGSAAGMDAQTCEAYRRTLKITHRGRNEKEHWLDNLTPTAARLRCRRMAFTRQKRFR